MTVLHVQAPSYTQSQFTHIMFCWHYHCISLLLTTETVLTQNPWQR